MSSRSCPDWPMLMEVAPDLQFKHYTVAEAHLPAEALINLPDVPLSAVAICCDLEHHVYYAAHTEAKVAVALRDTHWFELQEGSTSGPGAAPLRQSLGRWKAASREIVTSGRRCFSSASCRSSTGVLCSLTNTRSRSPPSGVTSV